MLAELLKAELQFRLLSMKMTLAEFAQQQAGTVTPRALAAWALHEVELAGEKKEHLAAEDAVGKALARFEEGELEAEELARNEARIFGKAEEDQEAAAVRARVEQKGLTIIGGEQ